MFDVLFGHIFGFLNEIILKICGYRYLFYTVNCPKNLGTVDIGVDIVMKMGQKMLIRAVT